MSGKTICHFIDNHHQILRCQPPHHKGGRSRSGGAPGQSEGERGRQESGETDEVDESEMNVSKLNANSYELSSTDDYRLPCNKYTQNTGDKVQ